MCDVNGFTNHALSTASILGLFIISIDRYISIFYPLRYHEYMTSKRAAILIICTWSYALFTAILPLTGWSQYVFIKGIWLCVTDFKKSISFSYFIILSVYGIPLTIMSFIYYKIFKIAFHHAKAIEQQVVTCDKNGDNEVKPTVNKWLNATVNANFEASESHVETSYGAIADNSTNRRERRKSRINGIGPDRNQTVDESRKKIRRLLRLKKEVRTGLILFVIVVIFVASWTPFAILNLWSMHTGKRTSITSEAIVSRLAYTNSAINPPLYCLMNKVIRQSVYKLWQRIFTAFGHISCKKCTKSNDNDAE